MKKLSMIVVLVMLVLAILACGVDLSLGPTPTPTLTNTPTVTSTPTATFTPLPTDTPRPTSTPKPTATPARLTDDATCNEAVVEVFDELGWATTPGKLADYIDMVWNGSWAPGTYGSYIQTCLVEGWDWSQVGARSTQPNSGG